MAARVLVVDDEAAARAYHGSLLREAGFEVAEASGGIEALHAALTAEYDLFVVDVDLAQMDGYTCVGELRDRETTTYAPIVMTSTEHREADAERAYEAGANVYLTKPVPGSRLVWLARMLTGAG